MPATTFHIISESTPWWLVVLPAFTGLAGAWLVAIYQHRGGNKKWKKDARLLAYTNLISLSQSSSQMVVDLLANLPEATAIGLSAKFSSVSNAVTVVGMVGPASMVGYAQAILNVTEKIWDEVSEPSKLMAAQIAYVGSKKYPLSPRLSNAIDTFTLNARAALGSES